MNCLAPTLIRIFNHCLRLTLTTQRTYVMASVNVCAFDTLLKQNVPHIFEMIFLSLDYKSLKACLLVCDTWYRLLKSEPIHSKSRLIHKVKIEQDENIFMSSCKKGKVEKVRHLLKQGIYQWINGKGKNAVSLTPMISAVRFGHKDLVQLFI